MFVLFKVSMPLLNNDKLKNLDNCIIIKQYWKHPCHPMYSGISQNCKCREECSFWAGASQLSQLTERCIWLTSQSWWVASKQLCSYGSAKKEIYHDLFVFSYLPS